MAAARVFRWGNGQAIRLPKEFQVRSKELEIFRRGEEIILREKRKGLARAYEIIADLPDDFFAGGRKDMRSRNDAKESEWTRDSSSRPGKPRSPLSRSVNYCTARRRANFVGLP
jgi:antitoxin VapB